MSDINAEAPATPRLHFGAAPPEPEIEADVQIEDETTSVHSPDEPSPEELAALAEQNAQFVSEETLTAASSGSGEEPEAPDFAEVYDSLSPEEQQTESFTEANTLTDAEETALDAELEEQEEGNLSEVSDGETNVSGTPSSADTEGSESLSTPAAEATTASELEEAEAIDIQVEEVPEDGPSVEELRAEQERIAAQIQEKETAEKQNVLGQVKNVLEMYKISTEELVEFLGGLKIRRKGVKAKAKFRDPKTGVTWSGRGKTPTWMKGLDPEKFRIVDNGAEG